MMKYKLSHIVMSFVVSLGILLVSLYAYQQYFVIKPLSNALANVEDVTDYTIQMQRSNRTIEVSLKTEDLMLRYHEVLSIVKEYDSSESFDIILIDQRNVDLQSIFKDIRFELYEAIETKQYSQFNSIIDTVERPFTLFIDMDEKYIYLNLNNGEDYLYEMIPRYQMIG